jgi:hypothetical protein
MCDTDSVKYCSSGISGEFEVSPGTALGQWEDEGSAEEFVSVGLKSYAMKLSEGSEIVKIKGCSLKRSHNQLVNFESMCRALKDKQIMEIPQISFDYKYGQGIETREYLKKIQFDSDELKGSYDSENFQLFPYGYIKNTLK